MKQNLVHLVVIEITDENKQTLKEYSSDAEALFDVYKQKEKLKKDVVHGSCTTMSESDAAVMRNIANAYYDSDYEKQLEDLIGILEQAKKLMENEDKTT